MSTVKTIFPSIGYLLIALAVLFGVSLSLDDSARTLMLAESGIIETASAAGYFLCAGYILVCSRRFDLPVYPYFPLLFILFGLRELDFDKRFTSIGLLKSKFYVSSVPTLGEKTVGILLITLLLYLAWCLLKNHIWVWKRAINTYSQVYIGGLMTFSLMVLAKTIDGLPRKLRPLGVQVNDTLATRLNDLEEILELGIPGLIFLSILAYVYAVESQRRQPASLAWEAGSDRTG